MIGKETIKTTPVTPAKALEILKQRKEEEELKFEQRLAYDHAQKFSLLSADEADKLVSDLLNITKIRKHQAVVLATIMPKTRDDIQLIFAKERTALNEDDITKILKTIDNYRK